MNNIRYSKSLEEVWQWKEAVYRDIKNMPHVLRNISARSKKITERLGLRRISSYKDSNKD